MHVDTGHNFPEVIDVRDRRGRPSSGARPGGRLRRRTPSTPGAWSRRPGGARRATGSRPPRCSTRSRSTEFDARLRRRAGATRRRPAPRSGCSPSATTSASGTRRTSGPSCGTSTTRKHPPGRAHPGLPAVQLDRARHLGLHRGARSIEIPSIYFAHTPHGVRARRHAAGRRRGRPARGDDEPLFEAHGALPHRRRHDLHRRR